MGREEDAGGDILELTVAGTPENSREIRQKPLTGAGGDMVHWGFRKSELLPLTFWRMRMKFWERISETLRGVWKGRYTATEEHKTELLQNNELLNGKQKICHICFLNRILT
jgi:hypothetical protein